MLLVLAVLRAVLRAVLQQHLSVVQSELSEPVPLALLLLLPLRAVLQLLSVSPAAGCAAHQTATAS